jgi:hypothetical protein
MIAFLNEQSLGNPRTLKSALEFFLSAAQDLSPTGAALFKDCDFFRSSDFAREFNALGLPMDIRALIRDLVFGERYFRCWRPQRLSNDVDRYTVEEPAFRLHDQSICEATERKIRDNRLSASVVSSADSAFSDRYQISVSKDATGQQIELRGLTSTAMVGRWISEQRGYYDPASTAAPKDFQTVLIKEPDRFRGTSKIERRGSRRVFEERDTWRLYYVCDAHPGNSAHLEVFCRNNHHLGKADINTGIIDASQRINGRTLKL